MQRRFLYDETDSPNSINIAPLVDISLMVLIAFVVVVPLIEHRNITVDTPTVNNSEIQKKDSLVIFCTKNKKIIIDDEEVFLENIFQKLQLVISDRSTIVISADQALKYGYVINILDTLRTHFPNVNISLDVHQKSS